MTLLCVALTHNIITAEIKQTKQLEMRVIRVVCVF